MKMTDRIKEKYSHRLEYYNKGKYAGIFPKIVSSTRKRFFKEGNILLSFNSAFGKKGEVFMLTASYNASGNIVSLGGLLLEKGVEFFTINVEKGTMQRDIYIDELGKKDRIKRRFLKFLPGPFVFVSDNIDSILEE